MSSVKKDEYAGRLYLLLGTVQKLIDKKGMAVMVNFDSENAGLVEESGRCL